MDKNVDALKTSAVISLHDNHTSVKQDGQFLRPSFYSSFILVNNPFILYLSAFKNAHLCPIQRQAEP